MEKLPTAQGQMASAYDRRTRKVAAGNRAVISGIGAVKEIR